MPNTRQAFQEALLERSKKEKAMTGIHVGFFRTVDLRALPTLFRTQKLQGGRSKSSWWS